MGPESSPNPERADWAVHVALVLDGVAGVVRWRCPGERGRCARRSGCHQRSLPDPRDRCGCWSAGTRPPAHTAALVERLGGQVVAVGSAGAKAMAVVLGEVDVYPHAGGQYEWDSAAPVAVAPRRAACLAARRFALPTELRPVGCLTCSSAGLNSPTQVIDLCRGLRAMPGPSPTCNGSRPRASTSCAKSWPSARDR